MQWAFYPNQMAVFGFVGEGQSYHVSRLDIFIGIHMKIDDSVQSRWPFWPAQHPFPMILVAKKRGYFPWHNSSQEVLMRLLQFLVCDGRVTRARPMHVTRQAEVEAWHPP